MTAPGPSTPVHADWQGILAPGETILWQGAPQRAFHWQDHGTAAALGGLMAFAVVFVILPDDPIMAAVAVPPVLALALLPAVLDAWRRKYSFFTLTDRRAIIGTDLPLFGRSLKSHYLEPGLVPRLMPGDPATVYFGEKTWRSGSRTHSVDVGFENLRPEEAETVYRLILEGPRQAS